MVVEDPAAQAADLTLTLDDGRRLAYAEFGTPSGAPLVVLHGTPGSRVTSVILHASAIEAGVRVIAVDRPGYGYSDPQPSLTFSSYADDLRQLLDALALTRVTLAGISGGGGFALGCARAIPQRLHRVVLASALVPTPASVRRQLPRELRLALAAARWTPRLAEVLLARHVGRRPDLSKPNIPEPDRRALSRPDASDALIDLTAAEVARQGVSAVVRDLRLYARNDDWRLEPPSVPVHFLHGREDRNVPLSIAEQVAAQLPGSSLQVIDDGGHLVVAERPEILHALVAR